MATPAHPTGQILEQLAEGLLPSAEVADTSAHVESCARCSAELESLTNLFATLGNLPRFAPSTVFADQVMARVEMSTRMGWVTRWLARLAPSTRRGWALISLVVTAPSLPLIAILVWLLSQPLLSPTTLWQWGMIRTQGAAQAGAAWLMDQSLASGIVGQAESVYANVQTVPGGALGGAIAFLAIAMPLSAWGLVRLTRTPMGSVTHAK